MTLRVRLSGSGCALPFASASISWQLVAWGQQIALRRTAGDATSSLARRDGESENRR